MRLFLNGLGASTSSGLTYIRNVVPELAKAQGVHTTIATNETLQAELGNLPNISFVASPVSNLAGLRFFMEQTGLRRAIELSKSDILLSAGNFALWRSAIPQILLSGNSLYTSSDFNRDLIRRESYRLWLDTKIKGFFARRSVGWADRTIAPSKSFAEQLRRWTGRPVQHLYHGFDPVTFFSEASSLSQGVQEKLDSGRDACRLLLVSHYNYFRNFETLFRAIPPLRNLLGKRPVKLFLTCRLRHDEDRSLYRSATAASLIRSLGIADEVVELGPIPYRSLHHVYRACDIYVSASYAETFSHPLVEAMATGVPILASEIPVHKEICGEAAMYFSTFSPEQIAELAFHIYEHGDVRSRMRTAGWERAREFSWQQHVSKLLEVVRDLCN